MSKDGSSPQNETAKLIPIKDIIQKLSELLRRLSAAKEKFSKGTTSEGVPDGDNKVGDNSTTDTKGGSKNKGELDMHTQLDKACKELNYMISAFKKLEAFEADISGPLKTLEANVADIVTDLDPQAALTDHVKQLIESNLKVLRSNITKVKIQIPLQHQVSGTIPEARGYLQTTVASKEIGHLPNPYEADGIFESSRFLKVFQDRYENLDDGQKLCLLCFAIFPENAEVMKRLLKFWWIGERLRPTPGSDRKKEEDPGSDPKKKENLGSDPKKDFVNETLGLFVAMRFIEPVTKKSRLQATSYKMHPIIRSFIIRRAKEDNFFDYDYKGNPTMDISKSKKSCLVKSEGTTAWFSKNFSQPDPKQQAQSTDNQQKAKKQGQKDEQRQITKQVQKEEQEQQRIEQEKKKVKNLEELQTLFNVTKQFPDLPVELFSKMRNIGVLYLGKWERTAERHMEVENAEFLTGLKNMKKLRFFSLQGISGISKLPKSISKLANLRVLDLRACHNLEELPKEVASLKMLAYLDLSECYLLDNIPKQLSSLTELKVLKGFVISKNSSCTLESLAALPKLEKLSINVNDDGFSINKAEGVFFDLKALQKLKIAWGAGVQGAAKSSNGKKGSNGAKHTPKDKGEKKDNGNRESTAGKSRGNKKQESDAAKSGAKMALQKLKIPWGARGEGSSKSVTDNKVTAAAAKPGVVDKTQDDHRDAKKQGGDAAKPVAKSSDDNRDEKSGMKLVKLDLQCFPGREPPEWLVPKNLTCLKSLYIRGGELSNLGKSSMADNKKWKVEYLRLKYLTDIKTSWKELQTQFPKLKYLEKVNCPQITFCPCDASGVWMLEQH